MKTLKTFKDDVKLVIGERAIEDFVEDKSWRGVQSGLSAFAMFKSTDG
ncbi:MAG: hypothetical protein KKB57_16105 [Proteobacteria bacterium]|nr:hypothetical protein [Pseudomonadota bacterium]MBU2519107.1 hypothetical protein [Pseudomonadota bacterium]